MRKMTFTAEVTFDDEGKIVESSSRIEEPATYTARMMGLGIGLAHVQLRLRTDQLLETYQQVGKPGESGEFSLAMLDAISPSAQASIRSKTDFRGDAIAPVSEPELQKTLGY